MSFRFDFAHFAHILCFMKNLTLRIPEETLLRARKIAAQQDSSINAMVRDFLEDLSSKEERKERARREILELCRNSEARIGDSNWSRSSLYDR